MNTPQFRGTKLPRLYLLGQLSTDGDGPIEWCMLVLGADAKMLAVQHPALTLRADPAHREAFVALPPGRQAIPWGGGACPRHRAGG